MGDDLARDDGQEESGDLPCRGDCAGVCDVAREEARRGGLGGGGEAGGEGGGDDGGGEEGELFGGEFGVGGGVCGVWFVFGVYGMEDQVVMPWKWCSDFGIIAGSIHGTGNVFGLRDCIAFLPIFGT